MDQVKLRLQCQNIFSAARHIQFGINLRGPQRPGNGNPAKRCYVALFRTPSTAQTTQPKPYLNTHKIMGDANEHRNRPGHFFASFGYLEAHMGFVLRPMKRSEAHRDESQTSRVQGNYVCTKCFCQTEPSVPGMNPT